MKIWTQNETNKVLVQDHTLNWCWNTKGIGWLYLYFHPLWEYNSKNPWRKILYVYHPKNLLENLFNYKWIINKLALSDEWTTSELKSTMIKLQINYKSTSQLQVNYKLVYNY